MKITRLHRYTPEDASHELAFRVGINYGVEKERLRIKRLLKEAEDFKDLERLIDDE